MTQPATSSRQFALVAPSQPLDPAHWPVRGDLAHVRLAGRAFVPHYAVPMPRTIGAAGAVLRAAPDEAAELRATLNPGATFNVLDFSGDWAWGQVGEDGFVGYLPLAALG